MMENSVTAVSALKGLMIVAVLVLVEVNAIADDLFDLVSGFCNKDLERIGVVLISARDKGILCMELDIVVNRLIYSRNTALSECGVTEYHFSFCDKQYFQLFRQVQSGIQTACARSCDNNVIIFGHNRYFL